MKNRVDKAIAVIRGYCDKMTSCDKCRYQTDSSQECPFTSFVPCNWEMDEKSGTEKGEREV